MSDLAHRDRPLVRRAHRSHLRIGRHRAPLPAALGLLIGVAVVTRALALFVEVGDDQAEKDGRRTDRAILRAVRKPGLPNAARGPKWLTPVAKFFSALGSVPCLAVVSAAAGAFYFRRGQRQVAWRMLGAFFGGLVLSEALKAVYDRGRPAKEYRLVESDEEGFPSGHAMLSAGVYILLATYVARSFKHTGAKLALISTALLTSLGAGLSRIYLGVHWANDVFAGWSAGAGWSALWWLTHRGRNI